MTTPTRFSPIVVALDASQRAPAVLSVARALATPVQADLIAVRAVGIPRELPPEVLALPPDQAEDALLTIAERELQALIGTSAARHVALGVTGIPWDAICRTAKERKAGLIVLGSHGFTGLDRLLGTTAARVVNHAHCSVLIVREPPPWPSIHRRIVVGLDTSTRAPSVLAAAVEAAQGSTIEVVRVAHLPHDIPRGIDTSQPAIDQLLAAEKASLDALLGTLPPNVTVTERIEQGVPWKILIQRVEDQSADLLVVGTHGFEGMDHILGTTAARVADRARCSVLVVR